MTSDDGQDGRVGRDSNLGRVLAGQYRIDAVLGEGGMGTVYRGCQLSIDRRVAIKLIASRIVRKDEHVQRFRREAAATGQLGHPNTVRLFDFGQTEDGELFMVMELLQGRDLAAHLALCGRLPLEDALDVTRQVLRGLAEAHALGIVHRDLKPANVFLATLGSGESLVKVMDFGVAALDGPGDRSRITNPGDAIGTPAYMAPEQALGEAVDARADVYATGIILFEMLTGRPPFEAETLFSLLQAHITTPPPRLRQLAPELSQHPSVQELLDKLLAKRPEHRPRSAAEVLRLLATLAPGSVGRSSPSTGSLSPITGGRALPLAETVASTVGPAAQSKLDEQRAVTPRAWVSTRPPTVAGPLRSSLSLLLGAALASFTVVGVGYWWSRSGRQFPSGEELGGGVHEVLPPASTSAGDGETQGPDVEGHKPAERGSGELPSATAQSKIAEVRSRTPYRDEGLRPSATHPLPPPEISQDLSPTDPDLPARMPPAGRPRPGFAKARDEARGGSRASSTEEALAASGRDPADTRRPSAQLAAKLDRPGLDQGEPDRPGLDQGEPDQGEPDRPGLSPEVSGAAPDPSLDESSRSGASETSPPAQRSPLVPPPSDPPPVSGIPLADPSPSVPSVIAAPSSARLPDVPVDPATARNQKMLTSEDPDERRKALLRRGLEFNSMAAVERARAQGKLNQRDYDDHIWVLRHRRAALMRALDSEHDSGRINAQQYKVRRDAIDRDFHGD